MAVVRVPDQGLCLDETDAVTGFLARHGIDHERWAPSHPLAATASAEEVLAAYDAEIARLKARGGYVTADVIDVRPETPGLEAMLAKFLREHWHDEDEVRFILEGRGVFFIHPREGDVFAIEVGPGDLIRVPARDVALVLPLRGAPDPRDPALPGPGRVDPALHRERGGRGLRAGLPRSRAPLRPRVSGEAALVLLDVEGTTTPIDFVLRVLFPDARERVGAFLDSHSGDARCRARPRGPARGVGA